MSSLHSVEPILLKAKLNKTAAAVWCILQEEKGGKEGTFKEEIFVRDWLATGQTDAWLKDWQYLFIGDLVLSSPL